MKRLALVLLVFLFALPVVANAQTYHRPYYVQRPLPEVQKRPYFLENRTGSPLKVILLVEIPTAGKQRWPFEIAPDSEVYAMLPLGGVRVSVESAIALVSKGDKIVSEKAKSSVYERELRNGRLQTGWFFYRGKT